MARHSYGLRSQSLTTPSRSGRSNSISGGSRALITGLINAAANLSGGSRTTTQFTPYQRPPRRNNRPQREYQAPQPMARSLIKAKYIPSVAGKYVKRKTMRNKNGKKGLKITRSFRKKVKIATEDKKPNGLLKEYYYGKYSYGPSEKNTQQVVYTPVSNLFTPELFNDAASILWNTKAPAAVPSKVTTGNFPNESLDLWCNNSYAIHRLRNNSHRIMHIKFYECKPKAKQTLAFNTTPIENWANSLFEGNNASSGVNGFNPANITQNMIHTTPGMVPSFRENWTYTTTTLILSPGQDHTIRTQGPKDIMMKFSKLYNGTSLINNQPFTRYTFMVYYPDLVGATFTGAGANSGYFAGTGEASDSTHGILVETELVYSLRMPEVVGGTSAAAGVIESNNLRREAFVVSNYVDTATVLTVGRIDDEQPATDEALNT